MPVYEFRCEECRYDHDATFSMAEYNGKAGIACPRCGKFALERYYRTTPTTHIPLDMQACPDKLAHHGIKDIVTGEGLKPFSDSEQAYRKMKNKQYGKEKK